MEKFPSPEKRSSVDLLDEDVKVTFEIKPEAMAHLPVISPEDEAGGTERFGVLLGTTQVKDGGAVHIEIRGVYQETEEDIYGSYEEGTETISYDLALIKHRIKTIQEEYPEYRDFDFLGDVHTHPASHIAEPSREDLVAIIKSYESGDMDPNESYVFGIGTRKPDGEMEYWFYRIVRTNSKSGYGYKALDIPHNAGI